MDSEARGEGGRRGRARLEPAELDLGAFVTGVVGAVTWTVRDELEPEGINSVEYAILRALQYSETSTATQLGRLLPIDQSRISRAVNGLVSSRLVQRRRQRSDRRVVTLEMTEEGAERIRDLSQRLQRRLRRVAGGRESGGRSNLHGNRQDDHGESCRSAEPGVTIGTSPTDAGGSPPGRSID